MRFVPTESLKPGMMLGRDILNSSHSFMLKKGVVLTQGYVDYLLEKGYMGAYITDQASMDVMPEEPLAPDKFLAGVEAVESGRIDDILQSATDIVAGISSLKKLSIDLFDLRSFDDYTYHHSVNVAVYAVAVGKYLGLSDKDLMLLSQAGICHDLGKSRIPKAILNKPGRLTDEEYFEVKKHTKYSYDILYKNPEISSIVRQAVYLHHENENGSGYPAGKEGKQIPLFAKIIHGVDVYDALTSKRPYKEPYAPADAFDYLLGGRGILFSETIVDSMQKVIPAFPPGIDVCLSNGEIALVIGHSSNPMRPMLRMADGSTVNLETDPRYHGVTITSSGILPLDFAGKIEKNNEDRQAVRTQRKKVMIVDDSAVSLQHTCASLSEELYDIIGLSSGFAALNYFQTKGKPDLLIIDVDMAGLNGIATVNTLKKQGLATMPIIFLTSVADRATVLKCRSMGATDYIVKPAQPTYIQDRVAVALDRNLARW